MNVIDSYRKLTNKIILSVKSVVNPLKSATTSTLKAFLMRYVTILQTSSLSVMVATWGITKQEIQLFMGQLSKKGAKTGTKHSLKGGGKKRLKSRSATTKKLDYVCEQCLKPCKSLYGDKKTKKWVCEKCWAKAIRS